MLEAADEQDVEYGESESDDGDSEGWVDVIHSDDDDEEEEEEEESGGGEGEGGASKFLTLADKKAKAKEVTMSRILSDADFR